MTIEWPTNFPTEEDMKDILKETITTVWRIDLTVTEIDEWLNNFCGKVYSKEDERRLALWLLCNFTYYNEQEVNQLCKQLYKKLIHDIALTGQITNQEELEEVLGKTYFSAIGQAGESGAMILYFFRQEANLSIHKFVYPTAFPEGKECIRVFIDDVTLSGTTAIRFFKERKESLDCKKAYYLTLFATIDAVNELSKLGVSTLYCTLLDERDRVFSDKSMIYSKFPELRKPSYEMAYAYGQEIMKEYPFMKDYPLGFKNGELCFGFHYNIPNNTLPIFWAQGNWMPILQRKEKVYGKKEAILDKYI